MKNKPFYNYWLYIPFTKPAVKSLSFWSRHKLREPLIYSCSKLYTKVAAHVHLFGLYMYLVWRHSLWAVPSRVVFIQKPDRNFIDVLYIAIYGMVCTYMCKYTCIPDSISLIIYNYCFIHDHVRFDFTSYFSYMIITTQFHNTKNIF